MDANQEKVERQGTPELRIPLRLDGSVANSKGASNQNRGTTINAETQAAPYPPVGGA